ncbi:hypothetical protein [Rhizosaccharibacter radicis]|uniref:Type II secretion system protein GspC N-terminal domain-containing protein n=1 Tax=Rhizosaccharibacter radicis TaxID=2782605 RepID=A0ABT1VT33_9PROT|nr:hypothetical protein [Acetobacteraceae bacterium KSS12]
MSAPARRGMPDRAAAVPPRGAGPVAVLLLGLGWLAAPAAGAAPPAAAAPSSEPAPTQGRAGSPPSSASISAPASASEAEPGAARVDEWVTAILARPLFDPKRRPPSVAAAGPAEPRLAGILLMPKGRFALFAGENDSRGTLVAVGGEAGSFHVDRIDPDQVSVSGPDGTKTLRPRFSETTGDAGASAAATGMPAHPSILDLLRGRAGQLLPAQAAAGAPPPVAPSPPTIIANPPSRPPQQ